MKTLVIILLSMGAACGLRAESLTTADGTTYNHITRQRVDPDGVYIEYTPAGGGVAMEKIKFARLSTEQQQQFGYDAAKAGQFEAECARANAEFQARAVQWDETARLARRERQDRELAEQRAQNEQALAMAQLQATQPAANDAGYYGNGGWSLGGGAYLTAIPALNGRLRHRNGGLEIVPWKLPSNLPAATGRPAGRR